ncbi:SDR family oxidoreductase [Bacillus infantis]|uniref:elongation factor P 5-aminopentanone reductase n=1 Tax=Bacillus infantis TaxID=324767 RepID=UPI001CD55333|nr:SDR family oxidoreductase [Bacillus infantis]MCA1037582.1 SDR family oxidoreductase [Bacillus infantis]
MKKFTLVTGASGGIGRAIALKLAEEGHSLYLHYNRNIEAIEKLLGELAQFEGEYIPVQGDLADPLGYKKIAGSIFSLDAIIHNTGAGFYGLLEDTDDQILEQLMRVHVLSPYALTRELLPKLIQKRQGSIIMVSSIWGQAGAACETAYSAAKGAQIAFVKALSKEVALNGVRVNAIAPGAVKTPMMESFSESEIMEIEEEIPMGRMAAPEEVANAAAFLLSEGSSYITGQVLGINGGWYT